MRFGRVTHGERLASQEVRPWPLLLIDDEPGVLNPLTSLLRLRFPDVHIETAESVLSALQRVRATEYGLIMADGNQAGLSAVGFLRAMRKLRPETPVIILLERHEVSLETQVIERGAYDVLVKPLEPTLFCLAVARGLEAFQLRSVARWQEAELIAAFDGVLKDLEGLYRAYGLRAHFEALVSRRKALPTSRLSPGGDSVVHRGGRD